MRLLVCVALPVVIAGGASADNIVDGFVGFMADARAGGLMLVHGRDATGAGPCFEWQLDDLPVSLDLGIVTSSRGATRLVPGAGFRPPWRNRYGVDLTAGLAWVPSEYGGMRLGPLRIDNAAPYLALMRRF